MHKNSHINRLNSHRKSYWKSHWWSLKFKNRHSRNLSFRKRSLKQFFISLNRIAAKWKNIQKIALKLFPFQVSPFRILLSRRGALHELICVFISLDRFIFRSFPKILFLTYGIYKKKKKGSCNPACEKLFILCIPLYFPPLRLRSLLRVMHFRYRSPLFTYEGHYLKFHRNTSYCILLEKYVVTFPCYASRAKLLSPLCPHGEHSYTFN